MSTTGNVIISAYVALIVAACVLFPLIILHGYRQWWVALFYAIFAGAIIGGGVSRYRTIRRNGKV